MESLPPLDSRQDLTHMLRSWGLDEKYIRLMLVSQRELYIISTIGPFSRKRN